MKKEYFVPRVYIMPFVINDLCQLKTSDEDADDSEILTKKHDHEFEDFVSSQEGTKTNSLW